MLVAYMQTVLELYGFVCVDCGLCVRTVVDYVLDYVIVYVEYVELCGLRGWTVLGRGLHVCRLCWIGWTACLWIVLDCVDCIYAAG